MSERYVCVHGHFYQPPREHAWLESIEPQDSAAPFHDWNERITAECYAPNAASRIHDGAGQVARVVNNYARMSFNFGPTLLSWLETHAPATYESIREADRLSQRRFSGHGSALAQVYNHIIMPLANQRDKLTQIRWGVADFKHRFRRQPEGMWLAETAVDTPTLEALAQEGLRFTILAPGQAKRVRPLAGGPESWQDVSGGRVDPTQAYQCLLPSGRTIALFFYDGPISQGIAFEGLLKSGDVLAQRLTSGFNDQRGWAQLVHIATDGETYGHHHHHGDMALAYALDRIEVQGKARLTNYGEYLAKHPPKWTVEIQERTAWSCAHGIERWNSNCGCNTGRGWHQNWRHPLRQALDWLRDTVAPHFEEQGWKYWADPWQMRDEYIRALLDHSPGFRLALLKDHARPGVVVDEIHALQLLELQRHALLMYTSCGWFFDEVSGLETVQVIQYAGRVIQLAELALGVQLEAEFLERLAQVPSNLPEHGHARAVYEKYVRPARVTLAQVAAHYAMANLFEETTEQTNIHCYLLETDDWQQAAAHEGRLVYGRVRVTSVLTAESAEFIAAAAQEPGRSPLGGVRPMTNGTEYEKLQDDLAAAFFAPDPDLVQALLHQHFRAHEYSLRSLFRREQRRIVSQLMEPTAALIDESARQLAAQHAELLRFARGFGVMLPPPYVAAVGHLLHRDLRQIIAADEPDPVVARRLLDDAKFWGVPLDQAGLSFDLRRAVTRLVNRVAASPEDLTALRRAATGVTLAKQFGFEVDFWAAQTTFFRLVQTTYPAHAQAAPHEAGAREWLAACRALAERLGVRLPETRHDERPVREEKSHQPASVSV
jgi:alpha-amylase/alpha-mannosidase (GH57 family)